MTTLNTLRKGIQARRALVGPRTGINRPFNGTRERDPSAQGARDFNDVNIVSVLPRARLTSRTAS